MLGKRTPAASCKFPLRWVRCIPLRKKQAQAHAHGSPPRANHFNLLRFMLASMVIVSHVPDLIDGDRRREPLAMLFLIGGCFKLYAPALPWRGSLAVAALGMMLVCLSSNVLAHLGTAVFGGYLLCFVALHLGGWLLAFNQLPDVSYGMYLYGWPVNKLVLWWGPQQLAPALALTYALTLVMAWLSWVLIESPALRLKR